MDSLSAGNGLIINNAEISLDPSQVVTKTALDVALNKKQDTLTAGNHISIERNEDNGNLEISANIPTFTETDPVFVNSPAYSITEEDIIKWNTPDSGSDFSGDYNDLTNKPDLSVYAESADLATVATTGSYNDLSDKPTIPVLPTLATVATTGSYTDLIDKPTIPTVPTNVSDFTNDAGYITSSDLPANELPAIASGDAGKVLAVNSTETGLEWTTPASGGGSGSDIGDLVYTKEGISWTEVPADLITLFENNKKPNLIITKDTSIYNRDVIYTFASSTADHNDFSND